MYDAFGVDDNLYVVWLDVVQPMGFDHFKAFIQHGGRVYGDFRAHLPIGVLQRLFGCDSGKLCQCTASERTSRCGEQNAFDGIAGFAIEALKYSRVLAVDWQYGHFVCSAQGADDLSCYHECLFVG